MRIALVFDRGDNREIFEVDADGSHVTDLTSDLECAANPVWSPEGKHIAFETLPDGNYEIYVIYPAMAMTAYGRTSRRNYFIPVAATPSIK